MKRGMILAILPILVYLFFLITLAGCDSLLAEEPEPQEIKAGQQDTLPDWLLPNAYKEKGSHPIDEANNILNNEGHLEDTVTDNSTVELPLESGQNNPAATTTQQEQSQENQGSSEAQPGTMEWIIEQQKQREAEKRQREREKILTKLEEESTDDEDRDAWWDLQKKDEPSMSHQLFE